MRSFYRLAWLCHAKAKSLSDIPCFDNCILDLLKLKYAVSPDFGSCTCNNTEGGTKSTLHRDKLYLLLLLPKMVSIWLERQK
jgi:hypothetical protein